MHRHRSVILSAVVSLTLLSFAANAGTGTLTPIAGNGTNGSGTGGGNALNAQLNMPLGLALDASYNTFIADYGNNRIVRVSTNGTFTVIAGNGQASSTGDGGPASLATVNGPAGLAIDNSGNLYITEFGGARIRKIDSTLTITTIAGNGINASSGDGGPAIMASLSNPAGLATYGNIVYVVERGHSIRKIDPSTGIITTVIDNSTGKISSPTWVACDQSGNLLIGDAGYHQVLHLDVGTGNVTPYAGNGSVGFTGDGVLATQTGMGSGDLAVSVDSGGNLFIADLTLNRIRRVDVNTGIIQTVAGNGLATPTAPNTQGPSIGLQNPTSVVAGSGGYTIFTDRTNTVLWLSLPAPYTYTATTLTVTPNPVNTGQNVTFTATVAPYGTTGAQSTVSFMDSLGETIGTAQVSGGTATLVVPAPPSPATFNLMASFSGDPTFAASVSPAVTLTVQSASKAMTTVAFGSGMNPTTPGASVPFYVTVATPPNVIPTGTLQLLDGGVVVVSTPVNGNMAQINYAFSTVGSHPMSVAYSGDSNCQGSASGILSEIVKNAASGTIAATPNPALVGAPVTFTATLYQTAATGTIQFFDNTTNSALGTVTLANGAASLTTSNLSIGSHNVQANYSGDSTYMSFSTSYLTEVINQGGSTVTLTSGQNPANLNTPVTFTATVAASGSTSLQPSGTVQLLDGSTAIASAPLSGGAAQLTASFTTWGAHSLTAVYSGDANFQGSTSAVFTETVKSPSTVVLNSVPNPSNAGATVTFTATVQQSGATGTVSFVDVTTPASPVTLGTSALSNGSAALSISTLSAGAHSVTATYSGDSSFQGATSVAVSQMVKATSTTGLTASAATVVAGQPVQFTATVTPSAATGTVQFFDGGTSLGTATLTAGSAVLSVSTLAPGTHNVNCLYSGDASYASSSSSYAGVVVQSAASVTVQSGGSPSVYGQAVQMAASVSPSSATGSVRFLDGGTLLGTVALSGGAASLSVSLSVGTHSITAAYSGDPLDSPATSAPWTQTVTKASSTTAVASSLNPSNAGQAVTFTATVVPSSATGTVQFLDGSTVLAAVPLNAGTASFSTAALAAAVHPIYAVYSGDGNYSGSQSSLSQIVRQSTATTLTASRTFLIYGQAVQFTAAISPATATGSIQFLDGSTLLGTVPVNAGTASLAVSNLAAGTHSITAVYNGDTISLPSTSAAVTVMVVKASLTVSLTSTPNPSQKAQTVTFTATLSAAAATGTVTFKNGNTVLGTSPVANGTATFATASLSPGNQTVTAIYSGDANYNGAASPALNQKVK